MLSDKNIAMNTDEPLQKFELHEETKMRSSQIHTMSQTDSFVSLMWYGVFKWV